MRASLRGFDWRAGFTLLEVLIALAVIASALTAIVASANVHLDVQSRLQEQRLANWVMANALAELRMREPWPAVGRREGNEQMGGQRFSWQADVVQTELGDLRRVDIRVFDAAATDAVSTSSARNSIVSRTAFFGRR
jgi:general secretion pathway protein I